MLFNIPDLLKIADLKIFIDTPLDICLARRIQRDASERDNKVNEVLERYEKFVRPMFLKFIERNKKHADSFITKA